MSTKKSLTLFIGTCGICASMFLNLRVFNDSLLITSNVEALTTSYEQKTIDGVKYCAVELVRVPDDNEIIVKNKYNRSPSNVNASSENSFYNLGKQQWDKLSECNLTYEYGYYNGKFCWGKYDDLKSVIY